VGPSVQVRAKKEKGKGHGLGSRLIGLARRGGTAPSSGPVASWAGTLLRPSPVSLPTSPFSAAAKAGPCIGPSLSLVDGDPVSA
jgi:hypothetical protein